MTGSGSLRLGVNYWSARAALYLWDDVRLAEVDRDMARMADLGLHAPYPRCLGLPAHDSSWP